MCVCVCGGGGVERGGNKIRTKGWEGKYGMKRGKTKNRRREGGREGDDGSIGKVKGRKQNKRM